MCFLLEMADSKEDVARWAYSKAADLAVSHCLGTVDEELNS